MSASSNAAHNTQLFDPVTGDEVPKVDGAIAVGENLAFQGSWWSFEHAAWIVISLILVADVLGVFGAGWLAHASIDEPGVGIRIRYDRIARTGTPNMLALQFGADAKKDGAVVFTASDSIVKNLGAQRIIPEPQTTAIISGAMRYTFPADSPPGEVDFELQPASPGIYSFTIQVAGHSAVTRRVVVMP